MSKGQTKSIKEMTDEEIEENILFYTNIEFTIGDNKFILKNIRIEDFNNYDKVQIIRLLMEKIDWYQILVYDKVCILEGYFLLTERTKSKIVLVKESSNEYFITDES